MRPLVIGNWKMNLDFVEAVHLTQQLGVMLKNQPLVHTDLVVAPPFTDLRSVSSVLESERISIGLAAQHVSAHENGAYTGETSVGMLRRLGVTSVIVGHSERRTHYAMTDDVVAATMSRLTKDGLRPILCVGESSSVRSSGDHVSTVTAQLTAACEAIDPKKRHNFVVAYEPVWAIGTGETASADQVREMMTAIRAQLSVLSASEVPVLYGGSVSEDNAATLLREALVDGFLVGGASLKAESFLAIARAGDDCYSQ